MKAVLLLHGWLTDINDFEVLLPYLESRYDHVEKVSYPGHYNGSDYSEFNSNSTFELVENSFLKLSSNYNTVDVIGYSMGAALACYLASKYDFGKLVLLSPANKYLNLKLPFSRMKHFIKLTYEIQKALFRANNDEKKKINDKIRFVLQDDLQSIRYVKDKVLHKYYRRAFNHFREVIERVNNEVIEINNPCFIAWGELDQLVPIESAKYVRSLCKNERSVLKVYPDLSHFMILSKGCYELEDDIKNFLEEKVVEIE
jgi:esterase/lipase